MPILSESTEFALLQRSYFLHPCQFDVSEKAVVPLLPQILWSPAAGRKQSLLHEQKAVLLRSINAPQCGGFAVFARNMATGAFLVMPRIGTEKLSADHKITGRQ